MNSKMNSGIENSMNGKKRAVTSAVTPHNINAKDLAASLDCCAECSVQYRCARRYVTMTAPAATSGELPRKIYSNKALGLDMEKKISRCGIKTATGWAMFELEFYFL